MLQDALGRCQGDIGRTRTSLFASSSCTIRTDCAQCSCEVDCTKLPLHLPRGALRCTNTIQRAMVVRQPIGHLLEFVVESRRSTPHQEVILRPSDADRAYAT